MKQTHTWKMHGGEQQVWEHNSSSTKTPMTFGLYLPPQAKEGPVPLITYLSGLTCNWSNVTEKAGAQKTCAELGLAFLAPDTSPRGENIPDDPDASYDFGLGAGFYVDATEAPWATHYQMYSYITQELPNVVKEIAPLNMDHQGIMGHSMGGHGALTIGLKNPATYKSVSAFAPICAPSQCPWGQKALSHYLGKDETTWREYDACALLEDGHRCADILVDQGTADQFLEDQLKPHLLTGACGDANQQLTLNHRKGYDHSYYFMASFMEEHLRWHYERLKK